MVDLTPQFWFEVADETRSIAEIPADVTTAVLDFLNAAKSAQEIAYAVPLLDGWTAAPVHSQSILDSRGSGFTGLAGLWAVPGLGPARFTEVVRSIAKTDQPIVPSLFSATSTAVPFGSSSETELKFEYELLLPGPLHGFKGRYPPPGRQVRGFGSRGCTSASSCDVFASSFNQQLNRHEAQIEITGLLLFGENDDSKVSIRMDHRLRPYDWIQPIDTTAATFGFPAVMQLNNSMMLDLEIKSTGQRFSLIARDVPCQVGRCMNWPPHNMLLWSTEPLVYYDATDPLGPPIVRIMDATTFLRGPENFLSMRPNIQSYQYIPPNMSRGLPAIDLRFNAPLGGEPVAIDHYVIYRTQDPTKGDSNWSNVSGRLTHGQWVDANPPQGPLYYRVVPVILDVFGQPYEGFSGQPLRVEPATSIFR